GAQYATAIGLEELRREQANEAKTDDNHRFTQRGINQAYTLQSDGADHGKHCFLVRAVLGYFRYKILRDADILRMGAVACDPVADRETRDALAYRLDDTGVAIAQWK